MIASNCMTIFSSMRYVASVASGHIGNVQVISLGRLGARFVPLSMSDMEHHCEGATLASSR